MTTLQRTVKVKNEKGNFYDWVIEEEREKCYRVFYKGFITHLYKSKCYIFNGELYSSEIRDIDRFKIDTPQWFDFPVNWEDRTYEIDKTVDWGYLEDCSDWIGGWYE